MIKIFLLGSGRSGTKYLTYLFKNNISNCISLHEPSPDMFGKPIYWHQSGDKDKIKDRFFKKIEIIKGYEKSKIDVYFESNHAFLKSFYDIATEVFPDLKLIHVIRNPLEVAKSQYNKGLVWIGEPQYLLPYFDGFKLKFHNYTGSDGRKYCRWALTGKEKIFQDIDIKLSMYQMLLVQWIEIEKRAIRYLEQYKKKNDCYTLIFPQDLNENKTIENMFNFFDFNYKQKKIKLQGKKNKNRKPTTVTSNDKKQLMELIDYIPRGYLEIFKKNPYKKCKWIDMLQR